MNRLANNYPRKHRLINKNDFDTLFKDNSRKIKQKYLLALYRPNEKAYARLGVIVTKKVAADAVVRNRIKRIIRESYRAKKNQIDCADIVVIARQQCDRLSKLQLREDIDKLWEKLIKR